MSVLNASAIKVRDILGLTARGQQTMANSVPVVLPSDQFLKTADVTKVGRAIIHTADSGNTTIISGAASVKIAILGICLVAAGNVIATLKEESEIPHTNLTGPMSLIAGVPLVWGPTAPDIAAIKTSIANKDVYLNLSAAVQVSGWVIYSVVDS